MNIWDDNRQEYQQRAANHFHGVFVTCVGVALRDQRISLDEFADRVGMTHRRIRLLLTGAIDMTLRDLSDAACGIDCELMPTPVRIVLEPIMTAADLGIEGGSDE